MSAMLYDFLVMFLVEKEVVVLATGKQKSSRPLAGVMQQGLPFPLPTDRTHVFGLTVRSVLCLPPKRASIDSPQRLHAEYPSVHTDFALMRHALSEQPGTSV